MTHQMPPQHDGRKAPTTLAWAPTPTLTDRWVLDAPAYVVGAADGDDGGGGEDPAARVADGLNRLGRPAEVVTARGAGLAVAREAGPTNHPVVVHVGSLSAVRGPSADTVARAVAAYRPGATITYDAAVRPELMGAPDDVRARVERLVGQADVVKVSAADLAWLYPEDEPRTVVGRWLAAGAGIVVSSGEEGAWAMNAVGVVATSPGRGVTEGSGAGEAFMAGLIDALWKGGLLGVAARADLRTLVWGSLQELVDNAVAAASIAAQAGGRPPTRAELDAARGIPQIGTARAT